MPDLTTLLSKFLNDLYAGTLGVTMPITAVRVGDGSASAPSYSFASAPTAGWFFSAASGVTGSFAGVGKVRIDSTGFNATESIGFASGITAAADVSLSRGAANLLQLATGDSFKLVSGVLTGGGLLSRLVTVTTDATAGIISYTAAQVAGGLILRDCAGAGRADTVPTAAALLAAIPGAQVGQAVRFTIRNTSGGAFSITVSTNTGVTLSGTMTIAQSNSKDFLAVFTNVTAASEAYTLYSLGTTVF